jgi:SPP1 gp7 family putative phage head morphogenesis protein
LTADLNSLASLRDTYLPHQQGCSCGTCLQLNEVSNKITPIPSKVSRDFTDAVRIGAATPEKIFQPLWNEYYRRLRQMAEAGFGRSLLQPESWEELNLFERMKRNLGHFSAAKVRTATNELQLLSALPQKEYLKAAKEAMDRYNRLYLEPELVSAMASAQSAESWSEIQRRKILYPNLRYETAGDERVRESHQALDQAVYPVDDPFWDTFMPPNGYRCRCKVVQTDQPAAPAGDIELEPTKGFRNNPGKTGRLFEDDHPYFNISSEVRSQLNSMAENFRAGWERNDLLQLAMDLYSNATFKLPGVNKPMKLTDVGMSKAIDTGHAQMATKNGLLPGIKTFTTRMELVSKDRERIIYALLFLEDKYYFIIDTPSMELVAITDKL